jgi:DNA polymerase I-like protein with 3'-5' exonuclease and polymerase domains
MIYFVTEQKKLFEEGDIQIVSDLSKCLEYFKDKNIIEVDTETEFNTRNPKHLPNPYENKVLSLQLGDFNNQFVIDISTIDITPLKSLFEDPFKIKIFCNAFFDLRFIHHWKFKIKNVYDIFLAECILYKGKVLPDGFRGLNQISQRYLNIEISKEIRGQIHWRGLGSIAVIIYAATDVKYMSLIREKQLVEIRKINSEAYLNFENRYVIDLSLMSYHGFKLNAENWLRVKESNIKKLHEIYEQLNNYILDNKLDKYIDYTLFGKFCKIKWTSSKQVLPLFKELGIKTIFHDRISGKDRDSVDIKLLKRQSNKFEILPIYIKYKELEKEITTYGEDFIIDNLNPVTKRIHSEFFQINDTSRLSSSNPNLQNIPGKDGDDTHPLRKCFEAEKGNILVISDYSAQEPRITAEYSNDQVLLDFVLNGDGDFHSFVSTLISPKLFGKEVKVSKKNNPLVPKLNKKIRDIGKQLNLKLNYGGTSFTLKDDLECSEDEAQEIIDFLNNRTPELMKYFDRCIRFVYKNGYIISDNYFKSRTYFYGYDRLCELHNKPYNNKTKEEISEYYKLRGELERFAKNNRIQNTGALMIKMAHIMFNDKLDELNLDAKVVNNIHDEIVSETKKELSEKAKELLNECMINAGKFWCKKIPMKTDSSINKLWIK